MEVDELSPVTKQQKQNNSQHKNKRSIPTLVSKDINMWIP